VVARAPLVTAGDPIDAIDTPALVVDLDALESNIARMAHYAAARSIRLRPHFKTHKCLAIAHRQIAAGAVGVCCQKISEAEILVAGGIPDVLVTNEILAPGKLSRLMTLAGKARIGISIDSIEGLERLRQAFSHPEPCIDVYVELDVGAGRCGVDDGGFALALVSRIADWPAFSFGGFHAYHGRAQHFRTPDERARAIAEAVKRVSETRDLVQQQGFRTPVVTGGGTGTFPLEAASGCYHEIQPGSYVFMDRDYSANEWHSDAPAFQHSLFIQCMVQSRRATHAVVDAGHKAHTIDSGMPAIDGRPDLTYERPSDEHGIVVGREAASLPGIGEILRLIPGHCDPTVNLYDWLICIRAGRVRDVWPIEGRGAVS